MSLEPTTTTRDTVFVDNDPMVKQTFYVVAAVDVHNNRSVFSNEVAFTPVKIDNPMPNQFTLFQNAPNPFNPTTVIRYALPEAAAVRLVVYNQSGQLVRVLVDEKRPAGFHEVEWNATNNTGAQMASGIYFYRLESELGTEIRRMLLLR
jgi:hypothetical protein